MHRAALITRRAMAAFSLSAFPRKSEAAEFEFKMGHSRPESDPFHQRLPEIAARIRKESNGRMTLDLLLDWAPDEATRKAILCDNPARPYRFDS